MKNFIRRGLILLLATAALLVGTVGLECPPADDMTPGNDNTDQPMPDPIPDSVAGTWSLAFDATNVGALSAVWGSGPSDIFVVGGRTTRGEVYHYNGTKWRAMDVPVVGLLVWVYGFGPNDVYAVGLNGGVVHYDGNKWTSLNSETNEELWGVWGRASNDLWIVGGTVGSGDPVLLHYNGQDFTAVPVPTNDRDATSIFKVWGTGSKVFAVGENGLIIEYANGQWKQVPAGANADDDFVSLWGTGESNIVAVGGRATARIATYNGTSWSTLKPNGLAGLNASFMDDANFAVIGGVGGYVGRYEPGAAGPIDEASPTTFDIHAIWGDGAGRYYAVGGNFTPPFSGVAIVRFAGNPTGDVVPPDGVADECTADAACSDGDACTVDRCVNGECLNTPMDCDDGDPCTTDTCDNGACVHTPIVCDDGDPCTTDICDNGSCIFLPINCSDNDPCTVDVCVDGNCSNLPRDCDDGNPCTVDSCDNGICVHQSICNPNEICVNGACEPAPDCFDAVECDDGDECTTDTCDAGQCVFTPVVCNDSSPCTVDACENGSCVFTPIDCDDGDPCTIDTCGLVTLLGDINDDCQIDADDVVPYINVLLGVDSDSVHVSLADMNEDGAANGLDVQAFAEALVLSKSCGVESCIHTPMNCDDGDPCTADACVNGNCEFTPIPGCACDLESDCGLGETCIDGACTPTVMPDIEIGVGGSIFGCVTTPYEPLVNGGLLPVCEGFQGFSEFMLTIRTKGFAPNAQIRVTRSVAFVGEPCTTTEMCGADLFCVDNNCGPIASATTLVSTTDIGGGINQRTSYAFLTFLPPDDLDGRDAILKVTVEDFSNSAIVKTQEYHVTLDARRLCFGEGDCPDMQDCVNNYCVP